MRPAVREAASRVLRRQSPAVILLAIVLIATAVLWDSAIGLDLSVMIAIFGLLALSVGILWGQAGMLSAAQAAFAAMGAYATAIATIRWGWPPLLAAVLAVAVPALVSYPLARVVSRLAPLALAIATLAFGEVFYVLVGNGGSLTGGYVGLSGIPPPGFVETPFQFHLMSWGVVLLIVVLYGNLVASRQGKALRTIRHDRFRAAADGVNVSHMLSAVFALSAGVAGAAGWLYATYITYVGPASLSTTLSISVLLMAIVGGAGSILGPLLGAALLTVIQHYLPASETQGLIYGLVVILVLLLAPRGVLGLRWQALFSRRRSADVRRPDSGRPGIPTGAPVEPSRVAMRKEL